MAAFPPLFRPSLLLSHFATQTTGHPKIKIRVKQSIASTAHRFYDELCEPREGCCIEEENLLIGIFFFLQEFLGSYVGQQH